MKRIGLFAVTFLLGLGITSTALVHYATSTSRADLRKVEASEKTYLLKDYNAGQSVLASEDNDIVANEGIVIATVDGYKGVSPNNSATINNYIIYKVSAREGNTFASLNAKLEGGRLAYYFGDFGNKVEFYVSDSLETINDNMVQAFNGSGNAISTLDCDMSDKAASFKANTLYVGFKMGTANEGCGFDTSWICLQTFTVTGSEMTADGEKIYLEKDYNTGQSVLASEDSDIIANEGITIATVDGYKGVSPSNSSTINNYLIYKIDTSGENVFKTLSATLDGGRLAYYFGDFGNKVEFYVSNSLETINDNMVQAFNGTGTAVSNLTCDMTNNIASLSAKTLYVGFKMGTANEGCGFDTSWICLQTFIVKGTEGSSTPVDPTLHSYKVLDKWNAGTNPSNSNAFKVEGIGGDGNAAHGAVVGTWGDPVKVEAGQHGDITYKVGAEGEILTSLKMRGVFRFVSYNDDQYWGDKIEYSVSLDNNTYSKVVRLGHVVAEEGDVTFNGAKVGGGVYELDLTSALESIDHVEYVYVRFSMIHLIAMQDGLEAWPMCVYETGVEFTTKDGYFIRYNLDGGSLPAGSKYAFFEDEDVYTLPEPTKQGYVFKGWSDGTNIVTSFNPALKEDLNVTATWEILDTSHAITYENTFDVDNPNPNVISEDGEDVTLIDLVRKGYVFEGWYDALEGGNKVTVLKASEVTADVVLYARWSEKSYAINYDLSEHASVSANGEKPASIKYSEELTFTLTMENGFFLDYVSINGEIVLLEEGSFTVSGSLDADINIVVKEYRLNNELSNSVEVDFASFKSNEYGWANKAYDYDNLRLIHDSDANAGVGTNTSGKGYITFKFNASEGKEFKGIDLFGKGRIFDVEGKHSDISVYVSSDNENYTLLKTYAPNNYTDGAEFVTLDFSKQLSEKSDVLYVKIELNRLGEPDYAADWVTLKNIKIELNEVAKENQGDTSESEPDTPTSDSSSEQQQPAKKGGCGGSIIGTSAILSLLAVTGIVLVSSRRKED